MIMTISNKSVIMCSIASGLTWGINALRSRNHLIAQIWRAVGSITQEPTGWNGTNRTLPTLYQADFRIRHQQSSRSERVERFSHLREVYGNSTNHVVTQLLHKQRQFLQD